MAPAYCGVLTSTARVVSGLGGMLGPYFVTAFVREGDAAEWQPVFLIMAAMYILTLIVYLAFGSSALLCPAT